MKSITKLIKFFTKETPSVRLGRWKLDYCNKKMNRKIDMSNEDHCGPCGQYEIEESPKQTDCNAKSP